MRAMRRPRTLRAVLAALALATVAGLLLSSGSSADPTKSQELFEKTLLADAKTTSAIKSLLSTRGGFVAPDLTFGDLTGDGRSDAIVTVDTGGVAGAVAVYVFSTDGQAADSPLRAVYRSQRLYRASTEVSGNTLIIRTPAYARGDDICCPAKTVQRTYAWNAHDKTLHQRSSVDVTGSQATR
jgi:hypothetical protein